MTVSLWIRETVGGRRSYRKPNKKKTYPEGTVFCLRYSIEGKRRWETLKVTNLSAALTARARKEAALLSDAPSIAPAPAKRINLDDAISNYLTTVAATLAHKTWLAYSLALTEFRKACTKEWLDQIDRSDLTALVVAQKNEGQDDRTVANRIAGVVTATEIPPTQVADVSCFWQTDQSAIPRWHQISACGRQPSIRSAWAENPWLLIRPHRYTRGKR